MGCEPENAHGEEPPSEDLVERARKLEEHAHELEEEDEEVEELERGPKKWLSDQPKSHWPPREEDAGGDLP